MNYQHFEQRLRRELRATLQSIEVPRMPSLRARGTHPAAAAAVAAALLLGIWLPSNQAIANGIIAMTSSLKMVITDTFGRPQELAGQNISLQQALRLRDISVVAPRALPVDATLNSITYFGDPRRAAVIFQYRCRSQLLTIVEEPASTLHAQTPMMIQYFNSTSPLPNTGFGVNNARRPGDFQIQLKPVTFVRGATRVTVISLDTAMATKISTAMRR